MLAYAPWGYAPFLGNRFDRHDTQEIIFLGVRYFSSFDA
jgi:hypothetical protein